MIEEIDFYDDEDTQKGKYMTFMSQKECFAIEIKYINEIIGIQKITQIPETKDYIKGLINLRGKIIPVIDMRLRFRQEPITYTDRTCIIIIAVEETVVGLIVEKICGVDEISDEHITPPPTIGQSKNSIKNRYVYGLAKVGEQVKLLLDPEKLIGEEELEELEKIATNKNISEGNVSEGTETEVVYE